MTTDIKARLRAGQKAYRAGNKAQAREIFESILAIDEHNEDTWLWMSAVVDEPDEKRTCLENVLVINPNNERARLGLKSLGVDPDVRSGEAGSAAEMQDEFEAEDDFEGYEAYGGYEEEALPKETPFTDTSFADEPFDMDESEYQAFGQPDENDIATSSASAHRQVTQPPPEVYDDWVAGLNLPATQEDDDPDGDASIYEEPDFEAMEFDDLSEASFQEDDDLEMYSAEYEEPGADDDLDLRAAVRADADAADDNMFASGDFITDDFDSAPADEPDPQEYFAFIPEDIEPTRLPGTRETYPPLLLAGLAVLVLLNVGALGLLVTRLIG